MINSTCCFTGHRYIVKKDVMRLKANLELALCALVAEGYRYFGTGGAVGFDALAAKSVIKMKKTNSALKLILVLPCREQSKFWSQSEKSEYEFIKQNADKIIYTSEEYYPGCMHRRNRHLVDNSSVCVAYLKKTDGGAAYTVNYAKEQGKRVIFVC